MSSPKIFGGIPEKFTKYDKAKIVLLPVPFDGTSTWQKGADKGFDAFIEASENMELYDIETESEVYKNGISILNTITENSSPVAMVEAVYKTVKKQIKCNKFVTLFEESIQFPLVLLEHFMKVLIT